jgi:hypothetical protein
MISLNPRPSTLSLGIAKGRPPFLIACSGFYSTKVWVIILFSGSPYAMTLLI